MPSKTLDMVTYLHNFKHKASASYKISKLERFVSKKLLSCLSGAFPIQFLASFCQEEMENKGTCVLS